MVHIQILDTYHSSILSRGLFQWPRFKTPFFITYLFHHKSDKESHCTDTSERAFPLPYYMNVRTTSLRFRKASWLCCKDWKII